MTGYCENCPNKQGVIEFLQQSKKWLDTDKIIYQQWVNIDRKQLMNIVKSKDNFVENLSNQIL